MGVPIPLEFKRLANLSNKSNLGLLGVTFVDSIPAADPKQNLATSAESQISSPGIFAAWDFRRDHLMGFQQQNFKNKEVIKQIYIVINCSIYS